MANQPSTFVRRMSALSGLGGITDAAQIEQRLAGMMGAEQARGYVSALQTFNQRALGGRARLVLTGGENAAIPGLAMHMGSQRVTLPVYNQATRLGTWGSQAYVIRNVGLVGAGDQISRMSGMDWFGQQIHGISSPSASRAFSQLSRTSEKLRTALSFHFRNEAGGGASPFFRQDMHRIMFTPEGKTGRLYELAQRVAFERKRSVAAIKGMDSLGREQVVSTASRMGTSGRLVAFEAMDAAQQAQAQLMSLMGEQGFSGASKITVSGKGSVIRATTIPGAMYGGNLLYRAEKGPHHQAEREIMLAERMASRRLMQRTMPYMVPETASEYMSVARGVANMRGISASSQVMLDAPIRLAGLGPRPGLAGEHAGRVEAMLQTMFGDAGVLATGRQSQSILNQSYFHRVREVKLASFSKGPNTEWMLNPLLEQYAGRPATYNTAITAEQVVKANRDALSGMSKAQAMEMERNLGTVGYSLTSTGATGRAIKMRKGEVIQRVLSDENGMRLVIGRRGRGGVGTRMLMGGETRMTVAEQMGRMSMGSYSPHFVAKLGAGGIPLAPMMLPNMAAQLSWAQVNGKPIGRDAVDMMSAAMGGRTQELAPGQFSASFGRGALGKPVGDIVSEVRAGLESKYGTSGYTIGDRAVSLDELMMPQVGSIPREAAERLVRRLPQAERAEGLRMLMEDTAHFNFTTTAALRANQPGRGGRMHFRMQKLNLLASQLGMGEGLFGAPELTAGMTGPAARAANSRNKIRGWWKDFVAPTDPRNRSIRGLVSDFAHLGQGDDALISHLQSTGRMGDVMTLDQFRQRFAVPQKTRGRIQPSQTGGYAFKYDRQGRLVPTTRSIILDLGQAVPQALGADEGITRRYAILPSGMAMGARTEHELYASGDTAAGRMIRAQLNLAHAATSGVDVAEVARAAGGVNASIGERVLGKRGWGNRQLMAGMTGTQLAMVPDATLAPGEIGITKRLAKKMGMSREMIDRARKTGVYGMTGSDPAFSGVHVQANRIRVVRRKGADLFSVFLHTGEAAARYRDFDADVMGLFVATNSKQNQAMKAMFEYTRAASKAGLARQTHRDMLESAGRGATVDTVGWTIGPDGKPVAAANLQGEIAGALAKDLTTTGTRVPYSLLRPYREITMGVLAAHETGPTSALWSQMGLNESALSTQHVQKSIQRMIAAKQGMGAQMLQDTYTALERVTYSTLNRKKGGNAKLAEQVATGLLGYRNLPEGEFDAHSQRVGKMIEDLIIGAHPRYTPFEAGQGARVAEVLGSAVQLGVHGARSPIAAFTAANLSPQRGVGPLADLMGQSGTMMGSLLGMSPGSGTPGGQVTMGPGVGGRIGEAGRQGAEAAQAAGSGKFISETAKDLARGGKNLVTKLLSSRAGRIGVGLAGLAALWSSSRGGGTTAPTSGAPMPPEPMINVPQDPGLQEYSQRNINTAQIERVPGIRTHAQVTVRTDHRRPELSQLGTDAFGRFGSRVVQSGSFSDDMAPVEYRHQMERAIHRRINSSF